MDDKMQSPGSNHNKDTKLSPLSRVKSVKIGDEREVHVVEDEDHQMELERLHPDIYSTFNITIKGSPEHVTGPFYYSMFGEHKCVLVNPDKTRNR